MNPKNNYMPYSQLQNVVSNLGILNLRSYNEKDVEMLFKICYWVGLRINEACKLKVSDFDLEQRQVYLGKTKTKKHDVRVIPDPFIPELDLYLSVKKFGYLCPANRKTVDVWIRKLGKALGIPAWITPQSKTGEKTKCHIFRKSIGKDMVFGTYGKKAPINVVSKQLGHTNIQMTEKYLKLDNEAAKDWWEENYYEEKNDK